MQIISSSTPCGDFFFWSHHTLKSQQQVNAPPPGSKSHPAAAEDSSRDVANIVRRCNELDLNIIVIWKVEHSHMRSLCAVKGNANSLISNSCCHCGMRVHAGLRHRGQQTAGCRGPAPCRPADHWQRGDFPEVQRGTDVQWLQMFSGNESVKGPTRTAFIIWNLSLLDYINRL